MSAARARRFRSGALGVALLALAASGGGHDRTAFLAAWLVAWCFCAWIAMGGLVGVWIHALTGGAWGEALRAPALRAAGLLPVLTLLFVPLAAGLGDLYPWAAAARDGPRWAGELAAPAFKEAWLQPGFFALRAALLLLSWNLLAWAARRPVRRPAGAAAASLIVYGFSVGIAAADWIMSLTPLWYSSVFGLEIMVGQALAGMAFATLAAGRRGAVAAPQPKRDVGNVLLTYVLSWGYLVFCEYLIIWAENLPHEIVWYEARRVQPWLALGIAVALLQFGLPFVALLFRAVKERTSRMAAVAAGLLLGHLLNLAWLILPATAPRGEPRQQWWLLPLCLAGFLAVCHAALPAAAAPSPEPTHA